MAPLHELLSAMLDTEMPGHMTGHFFVYLVDD